MQSVPVLTREWTRRRCIYPPPYPCNVTGVYASPVSVAHDPSCNRPPPPPRGGTVPGPRKHREYKAPKAPKKIFARGRSRFTL